jgi:hypothetical protein
MGLMEMKAGTRALITVKDAAGYGYGAAGRPPTAPHNVAVPPDSQLVFEVALASFEKGKDRCGLRTPAGAVGAWGPSCWHGQASCW